MRRTLAECMAMHPATIAKQLADFEAHADAAIRLTLAPINITTRESVR